MPRVFAYHGWYLLVGLLQVACAVHALRTDRTAWLWPILVFPLIGCVIYLLTQVRTERASRRVATGVVTALAPTWRLRQLRDAVEHCNTVENRLALATECVALRRHDEAIELYRSCRTGVFKDDPAVLQGLAAACVEAGAHREARDVLVELFETNPRSQNVVNRLLHARALEGDGATDAALAEYQVLASRGVGDEARCRYAQLLERVGRRDDARAIFGAIVKDARRSSRHYRRDQRPWIRAAEERFRV